MAYLSRIAPELPATDLQQSIGYYEQALGFRLASDFPPGDYAILERDGVAIHLFHDVPGHQSPVAIHVFADGLDELQAEFLERGARLSQQITLKPWGTRDLRVRDPSGNELKFAESASGTTGDQ